MCAVCSTLVTHTYFSRWGSYTVTGGCVHAQATPSAKGVTAAPSAPTLWTSHTRDPQPLLSPGVPLGCSAALQSVCQVLVCRPIESTKRGIAALSCCDVAQETLDQHLQRRLPGPRSGLVGHRSWSSTNISQPHLHKVPKRYRRWLCVAQYCRPTAPSWAAQWACGSSQKESTNIPDCYPQGTRAVALIVLNAGTAGLKHLPDFSTGTADLVKLKLLHREREKRRPRPTLGLL